MPGHRRQSHVLTSPEATRRFRTGLRFGSGPVTAVVRPGSLVEQWRVLRACVGANKAGIMQASDTGVTGSSTPDGDDYDRGVVLIKTMRITGLHLINEGMQVGCLPGTTLFHLEKALERVGRAPNSVIGYNVGHLDHAKPALASHYNELAPRNSFNPGIGRTKCAHWMSANRTSGNRQLRCEG